MSGGLPPDGALQEYLKDEFRVLNAHLPRRQKSLSELLGESHPHVDCSDGSTHLFKRSELEYLAGVVDRDGREALLLPMLIELGPDRDEVAIICDRGVGEKVFSEVLGMPVRGEAGRVIVYKSQLGEIRRVLKTTTQYLFTTGIPE